MRPYTEDEDHFHCTDNGAEKLRENVRTKENELRIAEQDLKQTHADLAGVSNAFSPHLIRMADCGVPDARRPGRKSKTD